jgi:hypothetical protein
MMALFESKLVSAATDAKFVRTPKQSCIDER